jgi:hypothetical protein
MTMVTPLLPAALAGALILAAAASQAAADDRVEMTFEGYGAAGVHLVTTHTVIAEAPGSYVIQGDFQTAGLVSWFSTVTNQSLARGRQSADRAQPDNFDSKTERSSVVYHERVDYPANGAASATSTPPPSEPVTPIAAGQLTGTVDSLTAYFMVERQVAKTGSCALRVLVFDGRHRYDLRFSDAGSQVLSPSGGQNFAGPTHVCRMVRDEIGGFYVDKKHTEGAHAGTIWYAQLMKGDLATPVRSEMDTEIGTVSIYLSQLRGRGVSLKLMD